MHLLVDARKLRHGGIGRFTENLLRGLVLNPNLELSVICASPEEAQTIKSLPNQQCELQVYTCSAKQYSLSEYFFLPFRFRNLLSKVDWYFSPHYTLPFFIGCKKAIVVHDCIHVTNPDSIFHKIIGKYLIGSSLKRADKVFTVSDASKRVIEREFRDVCGDIFVVPNSLSPEFDLLQNISSEDTLSEHNFLFIGADRPHKRVELFLNFLLLLRETGTCFKARIVGVLKRETKEFIRSSNLTGQVEVFENLLDKDLVSVYKNSNFYICTSAEEGFCLPILESMRMGLGVIAPELPFSRELLGEAGWYYESGSEVDLLRTFVKASDSREDGVRKVELGRLKSNDYSISRISSIFKESLL